MKQQRQQQETPGSASHLSGVPLENAPAQAAIPSHQNEPTRLSAALSEEVRQDRRDIARGVGGILGLSLLIIVWKWYGRNLLGPEQWAALLASPLYVLSYVVLLGGITTLVLRSLLRARARRRRMVAAVAAQDDIHAVGPLLDALAMDSGESQHKAMEALTRLLPRLTSQDAHLLNDAQRATLYRILSTPSGNRNPAGEKERLNFRLSIVKALEHIGDSKALPIVERLARNNATAASAKRLQEAASACLPYLRARVEEHGTRSTLLRSAEAPPEPDWDAITLVRPLPPQDGDTSARLQYAGTGTEPSTSAAGRKKRHDRP